MRSSTRRQQQGEQGDSEEEEEEYMPSDHSAGREDGDGSDGVDSGGAAYEDEIEDAKPSFDDRKGRSTASRPAAAEGGEKQGPKPQAMFIQKLYSSVQPETANPYLRIQLYCTLILCCTACSRPPPFAISSPGPTQTSRARGSIQRAPFPSTTRPLSRAKC